MTVYPKGKCDRCGEPLRVIPCTNCGQREEIP